MRSECEVLGHHATETTNDILKEIIEDISNFEKDFQKLKKPDINEYNFRKQQINTLVQEKIVLQQDAIALDTRITEVGKWIIACSTCNLTRNNLPDLSRYGSKRL